MIADFPGELRSRSGLRSGYMRTDFSDHALNASATVSISARFDISVAQSSMASRAPDRTPQRQTPTIFFEQTRFTSSAAGTGEATNSLKYGPLKRGFSFEPR